MEMPHLRLKARSPLDGEEEKGEAVSRLSEAGLLQGLESLRVQPRLNLVFVVGIQVCACAECRAYVCVCVWKGQTMEEKWHAHNVGGRHIHLFGPARACVRVCV